MTRLFALASALALVACATAPPPRSTITIEPGDGPPSQGAWVRYQEGLASWYGREEHGKPTASGERFDMNALTAAHKTLRMHARVRVTNKLNGRHVEVRINDRGPYSRGRIIDLSRAAAMALDMTDRGVVPVLIEVRP